MASKVAFIYGSFNKIPSDELILQGDASVRGDVLNLTKVDVDTDPDRHSVGRVLYAPPVQFWDGGSQAIFDTTLTFKIAPKSNATPADGITFFIAPVDTVIPTNTIGASLGVFDAQGRGPKLFAVEFDTFVNSFEKQLSGPHIGIDIGSWVSKATTPMEDIFGKKVTATISYRERRVTVVAVTDTKTFRVSYDVDLRLALNQYVQVGVSASTGDFSENHFLYSWSFASALVREKIPTTTSFFFSYLDKTTFKGFELQDDVSVGDDGRLSLIKHNASHSVGRVLYAPPVQFWDGGSQATFETTLTFKIAPKGNAIPADGITFFIAPVGTVFPKSQEGASLGVFDAQGNSPKLFAVEFDTYVNTFERQLSGPHIGINIGSWNSKATTPMEGMFGKKVTAIISYRARRVTVVAVTDTKTFRVSYDVDLSKFLNQDVQVGVSAATGKFSADHFLYSWSFASALE